MRCERDKNHKIPKDMDVTYRVKSVELNDHDMFTS